MTHCVPWRTSSVQCSAQHTERVIAWVVLPAWKKGAELCRVVEEEEEEEGGRKMVCVDGNTGRAECVLSCVREAMADGSKYCIHILGLRAIRD